MPFDPNAPFVPADPSQWWRTRMLPRILVQPNAPPNEASSNPAGSDGIDDWFVPGQAPNPTDLPNDWIVPGSAQTDASQPDDWIYPDDRNAPTPGATPPAPSPQPMESADGATPKLRDCCRKMRDSLSFHLPMLLQANVEHGKIRLPTRAMTPCQSSRHNMISSGSGHEN
jgi:hypothetical protein